jgi:hypothetical protein
MFSGFICSNPLNNVEFSGFKLFVSQEYAKLARNRIV